MSLGAEAEFYLVDLETFSGLRRVVRRLQAEDPLAGEDRRNLAVRMNALLQKAQPESRGAGRATTDTGGPTMDSDHWASSSLLKKDLWKHRAHV
jgi:hypothetical protein